MRASSRREASERARSGRRALRLRPLSRSRAGAAGPGAPCVRQSRGGRARRGGAAPCRRRRECRARVGRRSRRVRHGGRGAASRSRAAPQAWRALDVAIVPGVTAMLAVAARVGAPLGHDFCALSLSDNLKPWELIERRLDAAAGAASSSRSTIRSRARGPGSSARPSRCCAQASAGRDAGGVRPRGRARRREHDGHHARCSDRTCRRHGDADHRRLARDAGNRARRDARRWSTRRGRSRARCMIEPGTTASTVATDGDVRQGRAPQHDDRNAGARAPPRSCRRSRCRRCSWRR